MADARRLGRLLRVRELQLTVRQAAEADASAKLASEHALRQRVAELAADVAPREASTAAASLQAAAHYRERLHQTVHAVEQRVRVAEQGVEHARAATREAKRDQTAMEKLAARAEREAMARMLKALEDAPHVRRVRHDPC